MQACQRQDWKSHHNFECKLLAADVPRILPTNVRATIRLLRLEATNRLSEDQKAALETLTSHRQDLESAGGPFWEKVVQMSTWAQRRSGTKASLDSVIDICCKVGQKRESIQRPGVDKSAYAGLGS